MKQTINIRLRLIIIKQEKVLLTYDSIDDYYFYVGGKLEYGETVKEGAIREIHEECGKDVVFTFKKILYIRDFIIPEKEHSLELFILGDINSFAELEKRKDAEFNGKKWLTWVSMNALPKNLYPVELSEKLLADYKKGFPNQGEYVGKM